MNKHLKTDTLWCFKRWTRKPWAAFAGLCRFKIGVLAVTMSIILLATTIASAQEVHVDTVKITGRAPADPPTSPLRSQTRFLVDQRQNAPLGTSEQLLRLAPAIDVRERGGKSIQTDIAIRGGSFDQTMVMLNGIDFSDARTGHQSHSLPVDLDILSDIAVLDFATQPGALSGAVDFRTAPAFPRYLRARLEGGAWGYGYGNLSGAWSSLDSGSHFGSRYGERLSVMGAASYRRSDGYRHNTDFWNINAYTFVDYSSSRVGHFQIQGGFQRRDWGSNGFYSLRYPDQFESTLTGLASLRWWKSWRRLRLEAVGSFRQNDDQFEMVRDNPDPVTGGIPFNEHTTYNLYGSLSANYDWRRAGTSSLGTGLTYHQMFSTAMGDGNESRRLASVWLAHRKDWNRLWVNGIATLVVTPYGTDGTFGAETGWRVNRIVNLKAGALRSMRLPTFTDLFYNVATYHPDPNLRPEAAMTYRVAAEAAHENLGATAALYYRDTHNVIDWEQHPDGDWYSTQLNRLGTVGAELSVRWLASESSAAEHRFLRSAMLSYGYIHSDMSVATGYISKYALDYMHHKVSAVVGVEFGAGFGLTLTGSFYDRVGSYIAADGVQQGYKPYFLLDGRLSWRQRPQRLMLREMQFYIDIANLTDTNYFDFGGLPMPGRWLSAGVTVMIL